MTTMVEKVARALAFADGSRFAGPGQSKATREFGWKGDGEHFEKYADVHWKEHVVAAQMAFEAMRVPSDGVREIMGAHARNGFVNWDDYHKAMIDAALNEMPATGETK